MKPLSEVTREEFRTVLTDENVTALKVIYLAMGMGALMFGGVVAFLYSSFETSQNRAGEDELQLIHLLSLVHLVIAFMSYASANFLFNAFFKEDKLAVAADRPAETAFGMIRTALIIRLALYDGPALFGLVICLLASLNGTMHQHPLIALNLITTFILFALIVNTMPSKDRLESLFVAHIHS